MAKKTSTTAVETFCPTSQNDWRQWLQKHHTSEQSVWVIFYRKKTGKPTLTWSEAVDEALCFGWIDGRANPVDEESSTRLFSRRKVNGTWSKRNKDRIKFLTKAGLMSKAGLETVAAAKKNGSWTLLDSVERLLIPKDLKSELAKETGAKAFFLSLNKSTRKAILYWVVMAKKPETRQKRIQEIVALASKGLKPKHI